MGYTLRRIAKFIAPIGEVLPPEFTNWIASPSLTIGFPTGVTEQQPPSTSSVEENVPSVEVTTVVKLDARLLALLPTRTASVMADATRELGMNPTLRISARTGD